MSFSSRFSSDSHNNTTTPRENVDFQFSTGDIDDILKFAMKGVNNKGLLINFFKQITAGISVGDNKKSKILAAFDTFADRNPDMEEFIGKVKESYENYTLGDIQVGDLLESLLPVLTEFNTRLKAEQSLGLDTHTAQEDVASEVEILVNYTVENLGRGKIGEFRYAVRIGSKVYYSREQPVVNNKVLKTDLGGGNYELICLKRGEKILPMDPRYKEFKAL